MTRLLTSKYISVGVTYILWFSDFALYLEYYLLENVEPGILLPCDPMNDHLLYLGHCDLYFMSDFALYLEYYLLDKCHTWDISSL